MQVIPFPIYREQELHANISRDIKTYYAGNLDVAIKTSSELWEKEREYLQRLFKDKVNEIRSLTEYIEKLENVLSEHGLVSPQESGKDVEF